MSAAAVAINAEMSARWLATVVTIAHTFATKSCRVAAPRVDDAGRIMVPPRKYRKRATVFTTHRIAETAGWYDRSW